MLCKWESYLIRLSGNCRGQGKIWGYFGGFTTKIPPYSLSTTEIPKDPLILRPKPPYDVRDIEGIIE